MPRAEAEPPPSLQLIRIGPLEAGSAQVTEDGVEHRGELLDAAGQAGERRSTRGVEQVAHVTEQVSEQIARSGNCRDVQVDRQVRRRRRSATEMNLQAEQVEVDRTEHEVQDRT